MEEALNASRLLCGNVLMSCEVEKMSLQSEIGIRPVRADDAFLLWQWASDPLTRASSLSGEPIPWESHKTWFSSTLASTDCRVWILELDGIPAGQIRYERSMSDTARISFSVARDMRGQGLGTRLITMTAPLAATELGLKLLRAVVLSANTASRRVFVKAGFSLIRQQVLKGRECLIYERYISEDVT